MRGGVDGALLFQAAVAGDPVALKTLIPLVDDRLRRAADRQLKNERRGNTLSATTLVHEAYLTLAGPRDLPWQCRAHFYAASAQAMRRILLDHAKSKAATKPGGERRQLDLDAVVTLSTGDEPRILLPSMAGLLAWRPGTCARRRWCAFGSTRV